MVHPGPAMRDQVFASFIQRYFPTQNSPSTLRAEEFLVCNIGCLPQKGGMVDRAVSAISCLFLGKTNRDAPIFQHGVQLFNGAMRQVSNMIRRGSLTNETLYAVAIFQEINALYAPNGLGALGTHVAGMNTLLEYFRAKEQSDPIIDAIHHYQQKFNIIYTSTGMNISKSEYDLIMEPTNGDPLLETLQTTVAIGILKSKIDSVKHADLRACQNLLQRCYEVQDHLIGLYTGGQLSNEPSALDYAGNTSQHIENTGVPPPELLFGHAYDFSSPNDAILYIMLWTHLAMLQPLISRASRLVQFHTSSLIGNPPSQNEDLESVILEAHADRIARAMPYCFQGSMGLSCCKIALFAMCMVSLNYVDSGNREKHEWCREVIRHIAACGFDVASHLYKLTGYQWVRRWVGADPLTCISLRQTNSLVCSSNPVAVSKTTESRDEYASIHYADELVLGRQTTLD
ncbi:uncharacterized protein N7496_001144 [Penicillium cataractarum]|uniref:Transcription factor domain-containing protein n=1 Tax=Penicillium cataractarum TaxID=2100454 RepID=A0A9W9VVD9_9EURO|nr:uncharacterized protein N7496_001144 [Penicillium cataractarum]KAJ5390076.1 hypothetical protein N7496_001144 [Penicillium cataractarum]